MSPLAELLASKRVAVCAGSGGVGKTTVAASLAFRAALEGQRALVVTIDPARRLANSLGLESLGNVEARIGAERFARAGVQPKGELWAMMLDVKRTSDDVIARHATSREQAERIYANRFYQTASTVLAGSQEYMAMEKLYELHEGGAFDLVVLDTPPTANALDFLDAPGRLLDAFGNDALRWIATPAVAAGRVGMRAVGLGSGYLVRQLSKFTGIETLKALAEFLMQMQGMYEGFKERASRVKALLASEETTFVLVSAPNARTIDETRFFHTVLAQNDMPVGAVVVNRVHPDWRRASDSPLDADTLAPTVGRDLAERLATTVAEQQILAEADRAQIAALARDLAPGTRVPVLPVFDRDVHDLSGLAAMARYLFDPGVPVRVDAEPPRAGGSRPLDRSPGGG